MVCSRLFSGGRRVLLRKKIRYVNARSGKGPDIVFWANDRIGEWANAGLLKPLQIKEDFKAAFPPMAWEAVTHNNRI